MGKKIIKLTESQLEGLVKKIMSEENRASVVKKQKSTKSLSEGKEFILKFQKEKKRLVNEGYSKKEINEQLGNFLGFANAEKYGDDSSALGEFGFESAKQWMISWILNQLNISGELNQVLSIGLSKAEVEDYPKLLDPVDNCDFVADLLFETFLQYLIKKLIQSVGGKSSVGAGFATSDLFSNVASNAVSNLFKNVEFKRNLQKVFAKSVCQALRGEGEGELSSELEDSDVPEVVVKDIKSKL